MGIERLYADTIEAEYQRGLRNPAPPAEPDFGAWSLLSSGFAGFRTGFLEQGASALEGIAAFGRYSDQRRAEMGARTADPQRKAEAQAGMDALARDARRTAQASAPDPETAHQAEVMLHGLTRFGAKAIGSVVAAGPIAGAGLLGAEETNTAYRDLRLKGIDSETALKVAAVQGAISSLGVVLPVSGAALPLSTGGKVAATVGLVGVGGPGSYVAQETLSRDILQRAGYADEASKHDPTDWLGLGISTVLPGAFGAYAMRGAMRSTKPMPPVRTEAGVREAVQLTPEEQAASDAFERSAANLAELRKEIARQKDPAARAVLEAELAKQTEAAARLGQDAVAEAAARSPEVVDAARVSVLQETLARSLPDHPEAVPRLMDAINALSSGERPLVEPPSVFMARVFERQIADLEAERATLLPVAGQLADRGEIAAIREERALLEQNRPASSEADIKALAKQIQAADRVSYKTALSEAKRQTAEAVSTFNARVVRLDGAIRRNAEGQQAFDRVSAIDREVDAARRQMTEMIPFSAFRTPVAEAARQALRETRASTTAATDAAPQARLQEAQQDAPTPTQAADPEAAAPARGAGDETRPGVPDAGRPAAAPEAARVDADIVQRLADEAPDTMVTLPGMDEPMRLDEALAEIARQRALDETDADLLRAAVLCDLSP